MDNIPWGFVVIVGPILLGLALFWAVMRNRAGSAAQREQAEEGAHRLRDQIDREDGQAGRF